MNISGRNKKLTTDNNARIKTCYSLKIVRKINFCTKFRFGKFGMGKFTSLLNTKEPQRKTKNSS